MIIKIQSLNPKVKRAALEEYLRCAQRVHTIAFLQWRLKFPTPIRWHRKMIIDLIDERISFMYGVLKSGKKPEYMPNSTYGFSENDYDEFAKSIKNAKSYNIWSFEQIGLFDPYPDEIMETSFSIPITDGDLVYRIDRYVKGYSPNSIYFPSKKTLFKIMRACINVDDPEKLWFKINEN